MGGRPALPGCPSCAPSWPAPSEPASPVLGVCLGGQVMTLACGGVVDRAAVPEVGVYELDLEAGAADDPLFSHAPGPGAGGAVARRRDARDARRRRAAGQHARLRRAGLSPRRPRLGGAVPSRGRRRHRRHVVSPTTRRRSRRAVGRPGPCSTSWAPGPRRCATRWRPSRRTPSPTSCERRADDDRRRRSPRSGPAACRGAWPGWASPTRRARCGCSATRASSASTTTPSRTSRSHPTRPCAHDPLAGGRDASARRRRVHRRTRLGRSAPGPAACACWGRRPALGDHLVRHPQDWVVLRAADPDAARRRDRGVAPLAEVRADLLRAGGADPASSRRQRRRRRRRDRAVLRIGLPPPAARDRRRATSPTARRRRRRRRAGRPRRRHPRGRPGDRARRARPTDAAACRLAVIAHGQVRRPRAQLRLRRRRHLRRRAGRRRRRDRGAAVRDPPRAGADAGLLGRTVEGTIWPVDANLRPEGKHGAAGAHPRQPRRATTSGGPRPGSSRRC